MGSLPMPEPTKIPFDPADFLAKAGLGRRPVHLNPSDAFFYQGNPADAIIYLQNGRAKLTVASCTQCIPSDAIFYLQNGSAKLTVVSSSGKEATISRLADGDFVGEESLASVGGSRMATATAITACSALRIDRDEMVRAMHQEPAFSDLFMKFLLARSMRTQAALVDQLFNSSEKRLARILLLMAEFGMPGDPEPLIPPITQATLAEMIGTTRSRVSFFMNRFRKLGMIDYNGRIRVHKSLLNLLLHDDFSGKSTPPPPANKTTPGPRRRP